MKYNIGEAQWFIYKNPIEGELVSDEGIQYWPDDNDKNI